MVTQSSLAEAVLLHGFDRERILEGGCGDSLVYTLASNRPGPAGICDAVELATPGWRLRALLRERARKFLPPLRWFPAKISATHTTSG